MELLSDRTQPKLNVSVQRYPGRNRQIAWTSLHLFFPSLSVRS